MSSTRSPRQALMEKALSVYEDTRGPIPKRLRDFSKLWKWIANEFGIEVPKPNRSVYCNDIIREFIDSNGSLQGYSVKEYWLCPTMEEAVKNQ